MKTERSLVQTWPASPLGVPCTCRFTAIYERQVLHAVCPCSMGSKKSLGQCVGGV